MIIGDGIVLGAGGATASIFVTGLSETDTVTATNGSKTKTGVWTQKPNPASHGFLIDKIKDYGTWTVTATNGTKTATQDVLVDSADVFETVISYRDIDENVLLLIDGNSFVDASSLQNAITNRGVELSTAQTKFFDRSLYFDGASDLFMSGDNFNFGTSDFTVDLWVYPEAISNDNFFFSGNNSNSFFFGRYSRNTYIGVGRTAIAWDNSFSYSLVNNAWSHVAIVRASNMVYLFVNGVLQNYAANSTSYSMQNGTVSIGAQTNNLYFKGYMDEVRVSNIARWTSNFTPPTEPY